VFLDIEKSFDKVWHDGILYKMIGLGFPACYVELVSDYLEGQSFTFALDGSESEKEVIRAGVPQGSILGPVLFNLFINDLPIHERVETAIYADDAALYSSSWSQEIISERHQDALVEVEEWLIKRRTSVNLSKCEAILFYRRTSHRPSGNLILFGQRLEWWSQVKYLGIVMDRKLT
jgi:hypothetical protein